MSSLPAPDRPRPQSITDLFVSFTVLALQGFGGVLAVVQRELVEKKRWMTNEEFIENWAVAQVMPGPNVINLALIIGGRYFGLKGALAALSGMLAAPLLIVLTLVKINQPLKIFYSSSFQVQMVRGVFLDLHLFLAC